MRAHSITRFARIVASVALGLTVVACTNGVPGRAGGAIGTGVTTLTFASYITAPQLTAWMNEVRRLSKGSIRIDLKDAWRHGAAGSEVLTVQDVRQGKVDMAWVGARAMDRLGVTSFQALLAPMLVDSYDLETSVFQGGVPAQMLTGVAAAGVVGVGVLPGPMRKVMGIAKPFLTSADFAGARIGDQDSALTERTLSTLGATAVPLPAGAKIHGVDGMEQQLGSIAGNRYDAIAKFATTNLNLWPRPLVIIAGEATWAKLGDAQRDILRKAADAALLPSMDASRTEDQQALPVLCNSGMVLPTALPDQLADLRTAVEPVYSALRRDASTNRWLHQIEVMKERLNAAPETASCVGIPATSQPASPIDGVYWRRLDPADVRNACGIVPPNVIAHGTAEVVLERGTVTQYEQPDGGAKDIGWRGTYQVYRDTLELTEQGTAHPFTVTWSLKGSTLVLSNLQNGHCDDVAAWTGRPWAKRK